jgi:WD40 repeat protein
VPTLPPPTPTAPPFPGGRVLAAEISGDGQRVLTGSADGTATLWDFDSVAPIRCYRGHADSAHSVRLLGDGQSLRTASADGTAVRWDVDAGDRLDAFRAGARPSPLRL